MYRRFNFLLLAGMLVTPVPIIAQTLGSTVSKNPVAVQLLASAVSALSAGTNISDATLTGTVTRTAGSDPDTGTFTLEALGGGDGRVDLSLGSGSRGEVLGDSQGLPQGAWSGPDGIWHAMPLHNSLVPADWFFPALALARAVNDPSYSVAYPGQAIFDGAPVQHVQFWRTFPNVTGDSGTLLSLQGESEVDVYLDLSTSLPVAFGFNTHPDNNDGQNIAVEIRYGSFQKLSGILLPTHIEKLLNNSLFLDLNVTGVNLNSNLSLGDFTVAVN